MSKEQQVLENTADKNSNTLSNTATIFRLIALNITLIMLLSIFAPLTVCAVSGSGQLLPSTTHFLTPLQRTYPVIEKEDEKTALASGTGDVLTIGGSIYDAANDASGINWRYQGASRTLYLEDYVGGPIILATGDLTIYTYGRNMIRGDSRNGYTTSGMMAPGMIDLYIQTGSLIVKGANENIYAAGDGISSGSKLSIHDNGSDASLIVGGDGEKFAGGSGLRVEGGIELESDRDSLVVIKGGDSRLSRGGSGIYARTAQDAASVIINSGTIYSTGGDGTRGGDGITADHFENYSDLTAKGGNGFVASCNGSGVYFAKYMYLGYNEVEITGGGTDGYAIASPDGDLYKTHLDLNVTQSDDGHHVTGQIERIAITLSGNGGTYYGASTVCDELLNKNEPYNPGFTFTKPGSLQAAWKVKPTDTSLTSDQYTQRSDDVKNYFSSEVGLEDKFELDFDVEYEAVWEEDTPGKVILTCGDGYETGKKLLGTETYKVDTSGTTKLDDTMNICYYDASGDTLRTYYNHVVVWGDSSKLDYTSDANQVLDGKWYDPGTEVRGDSNHATILYAFDKYYNSLYDSLAIYHLNDGTSKTGGNIVVQGIKMVSGTDLVILGADYVNAPEGKLLSGWATEAGSSKITYSANSTMKLQDDSETIDFYAVWKEDPNAKKADTPSAVSTTASGLQTGSNSGISASAAGSSGKSEGTEKNAATTSNAAVTTTKSAVTTSKSAVTTSKSAVTTTKSAVTTSKSAVNTTSSGVQTSGTSKSSSSTSSNSAVNTTGSGVKTTKSTK